METKTTKLLIIGSGPAGYTAAIYAARSNLSPLLVQGMAPGGQLMITNDIENFPGFAEPVEGPWLMDQMAKQAERVGTTFAQDMIVDVDFSTRPFRCVGDSGTVYLADSVIIATGAQARWLGLESEEHFKGYGVSGCATCDGFFYRGKKVMVVGGGNAAVEEALYLAQLTEKVTLVHRRDSFRGEKVLHDRVFKNPKIEVVWDSVLDEVKGVETPTRSVTGAVLKNVKTGEKTSVDVDGIFIAIGHVPATTPFKRHLSMDDEGYILTAPDSTATEIPGIFAAGDVKDKVYRQAVTSAGMGCMAALEVERFLANQES